VSRPVAQPRSLPQAFPYQGSKRALIAPILSLFPNGGVPELVEPFAGSAAVSIGARHYGLAQDIAISDVNEPLMRLWRLIISNPELVIEGYTTLWNEQLEDPRQYFLDVRYRFNETKEPVLLLYLLARCVKAAVRYGRSGDFNQGADHRRLGARPANMRDRLERASRLMQGATVTISSYEDALTGAARDALVYLDPPYQGTSNVPDHRYLAGLRRSAFAQTLAGAVDNDTSFIVSYDVVTDDNRYGSALPAELGLTHRHVRVGISSQATLLGRKELTTESLYLSPALVRRLGGAGEVDLRLQNIA
jgi:DNA adenine methylase